MLSAMLNNFSGKATIVLLCNCYRFVALKTYGALSFGCLLVQVVKWLDLMVP